MTDTTYPVWKLPYAESGDIDPATITWGNSRIMHDRVNGCLRVGDGVTEGGLALYGSYTNKPASFNDFLPVSFFNMTIDGDPTSGPPTLTLVPNRGYDLRIPYLPYASANTDIAMIVRGLYGALTSGHNFRITWKQSGMAAASYSETFYSGLIFLDPAKSHWYRVGQTTNGNSYQYSTGEYGSAFSTTVGNSLSSNTFGFSSGDGAGAFPFGLPSRWFRVVYDGTYLKLLVSNDGYVWGSPINYYTETYPGRAVSDLLGGPPAYVGFAGIIYSNPPPGTPEANPDIDEIFGTVSSGYRLKISYFKLEYTS
jgi:hypothetical protein